MNAPFEDFKFKRNILLTYNTTFKAKVCNYFTFRIPEHTFIAFALTEVLNDPKHFPNPQEFKPERFLEKNPDSGKLQFKPHKALIPFGIGKRDCIGKNLAKMELFLFLTSLLHQFNFEPSNVENLPDMDDFTVGITRIPAPFTAKIKPRY